MSNSNDFDESRTAAVCRQAFVDCAALSRLSPETAVSGRCRGSSNQEPKRKHVLKL